jgi:arylsulfatase A-like enzyme
VFISDHGDMLGDHYHWRKTYAYEGSAKIPLILKTPIHFPTRIPCNSSVNSPVELRDILPTFLHFAGIKIPYDIDGKSLLTLIQEKNPMWRTFIDLEHATVYHWHNAWVALTDGKMKYIYFHTTGKELLFNLEKDSGEIIDLSSQTAYLEILKQWRTLMVHHLEERGKFWVKNGKLTKFKRQVLYSPFYPGKH